MTVIRRAHDALAAAYGPQNWWPTRAVSGSAAARVEIAVGAVLVQHTAWRNVGRALVSLSDAGALSFDALHAIDAEGLAGLVRQAGTPRVKAARLKALARFVAEEHAGSFDAFLAGVADRRVALRRRETLLAVHGVGPETADAVLLYAGGAPLLVVDAYARRVLRRHGWGDASASYADVQRFFERRLPRDPAVYNEAHALIVRVGVEHCRARRPDCVGCPLEAMLPRGGPHAD